MGDRWEALLSAIENIQEKSGHNIREMEEQLAKLTNLFEDMTIHSRGLSPLSNQWIPRPFIQTTSHLVREIDCPNLRQPTLTAPPSFVTMSRPINQPSSSRGKPSRQKAVRRMKDQWDPIPVTYAELLPKLIDSGSVVPIQARPRRPPFPKWYDVNIRCDYHSEVLGHSIEDCTIFKNKVQNLIEEGKLKFKKSNGQLKSNTRLGQKLK